MRTDSFLQMECVDLHDAELVLAAEAAAKPFETLLGPDLLTQIKLAHIAIWIAQQGDSVSAAVLLYRVKQAIYDVHRGTYAPK